MEVQISPILKKRGLQDTNSNNYRPIALATTCSKIFEHVILAQFELNLCTGYYQYGYKKGHGTELAVFSSKQTVAHYNKNNSTVFAAFLDASKAFDNVLHSKLCNKLLERGFSTQLVKCFYYWWKQQKFCIKWGDSVSRKFGTQKSVRQGIMSPVSFNVYTDQLGCDLIYLGLSCKIGCTMANCFFYADDICLLSLSVFGLQAMLDATEKYADDHNISLNVSKTVCMRFCSGKDSLLPDPKIKLKGCELVWVNSFRYLGFTITNCVNNFDEEEMYTRTGELRVRANMLCTKFNGANCDIKRYLLQTNIDSIYCMSLWTPESDACLNKVKVAYNDYIRLLFKFKRGVSVSDFCKNNRILTFKELQRKLCFSMLCRIRQSDNLLVSSLKNNMFRNSDLLMCHWFKVLYSSNASFSTLDEFVLS